MIADAATEVIDRWDDKVEIAPIRITLDSGTHTYRAISDINTSPVISPKQRVERHVESNQTNTIDELDVSELPSDALNLIQRHRGASSVPYHVEIGVNNRPVGESNTNHLVAFML